MRLGAIIYFVPFFFVFNPALLLQGSWGENLQAISTALVGVALVSAALQGYLIGLGDLGSGMSGILIRLLIVRHWPQNPLRRQPGPPAA